MNKNRWSKEKIIELGRAWRKFRRRKKKGVLKSIPSVNPRKPLSKKQFAIDRRKSMKLAVEAQQREKADILKRQALKKSL